jgi:hypothetical protein
MMGESSESFSGSASGSVSGPSSASKSINSATSSAIKSTHSAQKSLGGDSIASADARASPASRGSIRRGSNSNSIVVSPSPIKVQSEAPSTGARARIAAQKKVTAANVLNDSVLLAQESKKKEVIKSKTLSSGVQYFTSARSSGVTSNSLKYSGGLSAFTARGSVNGAGAASSTAKAESATAAPTGTFRPGLAAFASTKFTQSQHTLQVGQTPLLSTRNTQGGGVPSFGIPITTPGSGQTRPTRFKLKPSTRQTVATMGAGAGRNTTSTSCLLYPGPGSGVTHLPSAPISLVSPGPSTSKAGAGGGSAHDGRESPPDSSGGKSITSAEPKRKGFYFRASNASVGAPTPNSNLD